MRSKWTQRSRLQAFESVGRDAFAVVEKRGRVQIEIVKDGKESRTLIMGVVALSSVVEAVVARHEGSNVESGVGSPLARIESTPNGNFRIAASQFAIPLGIQSVPHSPIAKKKASFIVTKGKEIV